jgi:hypothetical protein
LVEQRLKSFNNSKFDALIKLIYTEPTKFSNFKDITPWDEFKFWTKEKDMYRNENFINTFNEIGKLLLEKNEWN